MTKSDLPPGHVPSTLKPSAEETPALVRAIEVVIDEKSALVAEEVEIYVSRNYEWDVALTGDVVTPQVANGQEQSSEATGNPRATFRNLEIRAYRRIVFRKSGYDVEPFIKVTAKGQAALAKERESGGELEVLRADIIAINNADIRCVNNGQVTSGNNPGSVPVGMFR
jgi:hypothetical protein